MSMGMVSDDIPGVLDINDFRGDWTLAAHCDSRYCHHPRPTRPPGFRRSNDPICCDPSTKRFLNDASTRRRGNAIVLAASILVLLVIIATTFVFGTQTLVRRTAKLQPA